MSTLERFENGGEGPGTNTAPAAKEQAMSGFVINGIEMRGFMGYGALERIDFRQKFTVITGRTGAGKTTLLDAITFALFNRTSRTDVGVKKEQICKLGGYVEVAFEQAGRSYSVRRGQKTKTQPYLELRMDTVLQEGNISVLGEVIERVIGLDYEGFKNATFVRQDEMKSLGSEKPSDRLSIFQRLFRLEVFEKARNLAGSRYSKLKGDVREIQGALQAKRDSVDKKGELEQRINDTEINLKKVRERILERNRDIESKSEELAELRKSHEEYIKCNATLENDVERRSTLEEKIKKTQRELREGKAAEEEIETLEKETGVLDSLREQERELGTRKSKLDILEKEKEEKLDRFKILKDSFAKDRTRVDAEIKRLRARTSSLKTELDKDEAFDLLRDEGRLEERMSRIGKEIGWLKDDRGLVKELEAERKKGLSDYEAVKDMVGQINMDSFVLTEIKDQIKRSEKELERLDDREEKELSSIKKALVENESAAKELGFGDTKKMMLEDLRAKIVELDGKRRRLDELRALSTERGDARARLREYALERDTLGEEIDGLEERISELSELETQYQELGMELQALEKGLADLEKELAGFVKEGQMLRERVEELRATEERIKELEARLEKDTDSLQVYSILKNEVFHSKGIPRFAITQLLPQLEIESSQILASMTDRRFSKVKLQHFDTGSRYGILIKVLGVDQEWHDVSEFSGGERTQINAALRFAISKELASMPHIGRTYGRMRTLFIDEGDLGSLDTEVSRELFVNKLFDMGDFFERIILITHLDEVADRFPSKARVWQDDTGISHIVEEH